MLNDSKPGTDEGKQSWYPEPFYSFKSTDTSSGLSTEIRGTFRSSQCKRVSCKFISADGMCSSCADIPNLPSFRKRLLLRSKKTTDTGERDLSCIRNEYLTTEEMAEKVTQQKEKLDSLESKLFFEASKNLRLKMRLRNLKEKLEEYAKRGSMKAICHNLEKASEQGLFKEKTVLMDFLTTISKNLHVKKQGKRYKASTKLFFEVVLIWGGPRLATFVATNLFGPEIHSVYRWRNRDCTTLEGGINRGDMSKIAVIYSESIAKQFKNRGSLVPVLAAEDETAIISKVMYSQKKDELLGFCGVKGLNHQCLDHFTIKVGEGEEGYNTIFSAFRNNVIGNYARAIILNPLAPNLPRLPILVMATCNCFDADFVYRQWQEIERLFENELEATLGPLIGHSSDGDSRRRKLMLQLMRSNEGLRFQPIPQDLGFVLGCRKELKGHTYVLRDLGDQDYIHNHKKLLNPLDHSSRVLMMGNNTVHMNHLQLVYDTFSHHEHGLGLDDVNRRDRQNWRSVQKLTFLRVQNCLQRLIDGDEDGRRPDPSLNGTLTYLKVIWNYVEIFCSKVRTLYQRIVSAALVVHFLGIWNNFVLREPTLSTKKNFISRETYQDTIISCHFAVILISYMGDNFVDVDCRLDLTGSDNVESFWSDNGQWVGNHHNYHYGELQSNVSHMIRLEQIKTDPEAPEFAKPHPKQECIWNSQYPPEEFAASLRDYPTHGEQIQAWKEGIHLARKLAVKVGMGPANYRGGNGEDNDSDDGGDGGPDSDDDNSDDSASWFYKPFKYAGNWMLNEGVEDEDEADPISTDETEIGTPEIRLSEDARLLCEDSAVGQTMRSTFTENALNPDVNAEGAPKSTISSCVTVPGRNQTIYKSTLVAQLNQDPSLSHDRLTRVRQRQEYQVVEETVPASASMVSLFEDYALLDRRKSGYLVGNVVRLTHKGARGSQDYKRPVSYNDDRGKDITAFLQIYPKLDVPGLKFGLQSTLKSVPFRDIMCHVNLRATEDERDTLELSADEHSALLATVGRLVSNASSRRTRRQPAMEPATTIESVDSANRTVVRPPEHERESGLRRSSRVRTVLWYDDE